MQQVWRTVNSVMMRS